MDITLQSPDANGYQAIMIEDQDADAFNAALSEAARQKMQVEEDSKARFNDLAKEFAEFMVDRVSPQFKDTIAPALGLYAKISPELKEHKKEKKRLAAIQAFFKSAYAKTIDLIIHKDDAWPKENSVSKATTLAKNLLATIWFAQQDKDVMRILHQAGIHIDFIAPVDIITNDDPAYEGDRVSQKQIIDAGVAAMKETVERTMAIEETVYPQVPEALRYDAESNPKGIKKGQFSALANVSAKKTKLEEAGKAEEAQALIQKTSEGFFYGSVNQKLLFDAYQQIQS